MQSPDTTEKGAAASDDDRGFASAAELDLLQDLLRMLPVGVTVQDAQGEFLLINDAAAAQFGMSGPLASQALQCRREAGVAQLRTGDAAMIEETVIGTSGRQVLLTSHRPARIADRDLLLSCSTDISAQKAIEDQLARSVFYDELTELPTKPVVEHRVKRLIETAAVGHFALAFLDIDNFKHVNDYYGQPSGDALLVAFVKRLQLNLREADLLARIGGDKFLLLLDPVRSEQEVADDIEFLLERLKAPFFINGSEIFASASIGVSLFPAHGQSFEVLRQHADMAMHQAKRVGNGTAALFDDQMERDALDQIKTEQALRLAILERRFFCAYQPKVDIRTGQIKGVEALVRLRDADGTIRSPGSFVSLAVSLGLIDELTHLVLAEIVRSIDPINETFGPQTSISINVAAGQAGNPDFMRGFAEAIEATGFPKRFLIEVTEDAFVAKSHFQSDILPIFRALGVGISIDDFGTGYSSLSALADITADEIKIDRSFIIDIHQRPRSQGILRAIVSLGHALGMTVIAEGIETAEELNYLLAATDIRYAQGYYFSKPMLLGELKPTIPAASETRVHSASRPSQDSRASYARADRHRR